MDIESAITYKCDDHKYWSRPKSRCEINASWSLDSFTREKFAQAYSSEHMDYDLTIYLVGWTNKIMPDSAPDSHNGKIIVKWLPHRSGDWTSKWRPINLNGLKPPRRTKHCESTHQAINKRQAFLTNEIHTNAVKDSMCPFQDDVTDLYHIEYHWMH